MSSRESIRNRKELTDMNIARSLFKREISYSYQQLFSECFKAPITQAEFKKVTNTVVTFLNGDSKGNHFKRAISYTYLPVVSASVKVSVTQVALEKVASTVATFLPDNMDGMRIIRIIRLSN